jgi:hypothetical protein
MRETPISRNESSCTAFSHFDYEKEWGKDYTKPGFVTRVLAILLRFMPKVGPFKALAFNNSSARTEDMDFKSINTSVDQYRAYLEEVRTDSLELVCRRSRTPLVRAAL